MRKYIAYYYLLFVLLIFGAFASMAQNDYGLKILGGVSFIFGVLFLIQLLSSVTRDKETDRLNLIELISLILLSAILAMRVFYIHFQFVEIIFAVAGLTLIGIYLIKLSMSWSAISSKNKMLAILVAVFHSSIIFYTISMTIVPFMPSMAEPAGGAGFVLLIVFSLTAFIKNKLMVDGEKLSPFRFVYRFKDRSVVLITLFLIFTAYMGFTKIGVLPKMYSDEFPQAYFELVQRAESGIEKPMNGKYRHEEFKEMYDRFISRQGEGKK